MEKLKRSEAFSSINRQLHGKLITKKSWWWIYGKKWPEKARHAINSLHCCISGMTWRRFSLRHALKRVLASEISGLRSCRLIAPAKKNSQVKWPRRLLFLFVNRWSIDGYEKHKKYTQKTLVRSLGWGRGAHRTDWYPTDIRNVIYAAVGVKILLVIQRTVDNRTGGGN